MYSYPSFLQPNTPARNEVRSLLVSLPKKNQSYSSPPSHGGVGERRLLHDLVVPPYYPWRERGQSRFSRVGRSSSLNILIGQVFGLYCPGQIAGSYPKRKRQKSTVLVGRFAGPDGAPVCNQAHCPTEGIQGYHGSHWSTPPGEYGGQYMPIGQCFSVFFLVFSSSVG
jgi:hypothetical protein